MWTNNFLPWDSQYLPVFAGPHSHLKRFPLTSQVSWHVPPLRQGLFPQQPFWHSRKGELACILGDPGAASRDDGIFMGESLQQERESPWALTLTERVPEAFEIPPSDWPEKYFSGQSARRNSRATLMSSYTRLFSSSNAVVAWPVQREHFWGELQKK